MAACLASVVKTFPPLMCLFFFPAKRQTEVSFSACTAAATRNGNNPGLPKGTHGHLLGIFAREQIFGQDIKCALGRDIAKEIGQGIKALATEAAPFL